MSARIIVKYPLPGNPPPGVCHAFQTDDLDGILASYVLTELGRLMRTEYRVEYAEDKPPLADYDAWLNWKRSGRFPPKLISTAVVDTRCNTSWGFYAPAWDAWDKLTWWQYRVTFDNGLLVSVEGGQRVFNEVERTGERKQTIAIE